MKKRFLCMAAALMLLLAMPTTTAYGAEAAVAFSCDEVIGAGQSFSAALEYGGATFGTAAVEVTYDPAVLEFRSCSGGEGFEAEEGLAKISLTGGDGREYLSCKIRFHAVSEGESFITVTASSLYALDGAELVAETRSAKVKVLSEEEIMESADDSESIDDSSVDSEGVEKEETSSAEGGLLGLWAWVKAGIEDGSFAESAAESLNRFMEGLSITEFLVLCLCVTVILLLLVLLAAEKGKGKK